MEEQLSGLLPSKFDFLPEFLENFSEEGLQVSAGFKHNCEATSFQLSYRLKDSLIANVSSHTFVYFKGEVWIDAFVGIIIDKEFKKYQKLSNFSEKRFDYYWGKDGIIFSGDKNFTFIEIKRKGTRKMNLE